MIKKAQKNIRKRHKSAKKRASFMLKHPFILPVVVFFLVVFFGFGLLVMIGASTEGATDKKIVNLFVDGEKQTVTTRAKTVEDLLTRLDLNLLPEDIVEPTRDTVLFEDYTQVNVYRARPVSIIDGERIVTVLSAHQSPRLIAADAGIELFPEDILEPVSAMQKTSSLIEPSEKLRVVRSVPIQLNVYGVVSTRRTVEKTVQAFLDANDISVETGATLQPEDPQTAITPGLLIAVNKVGIKTIVEVEPVAFPVETREDSSIQVGQNRVEIPGQNGEQSIIYEITEQDGQEASRRVLEVVVTKPPVTEVRIKGTKPATLSSNITVSGEKQSLMAAAGISSSDFAYVDYIVSKESGWRPGALNSSSGAYGLCQSLPASKMASAGEDYLTNPVTQLRWCAGYANGRYGGWQGAYNAWLAQSWW